MKDVLISYLLGFLLLASAFCCSWMGYWAPASETTPGTTLPEVFWTLSMLVCFGLSLPTCVAGVMMHWELAEDKCLENKLKQGVARSTEYRGGY